MHFLNFLIPILATRETPSTSGINIKKRESEIPVIRLNLDKEDRSDKYSKEGSKMVDIFPYKVDQLNETKRYLTQSQQNRRGTTNFIEGQRTTNFNQGRRDTSSYKFIDGMLWLFN